MSLSTKHLSWSNFRDLAPSNSCDTKFMERGPIGVLILPGFMLIMMGLRLKSPVFVLILAGTHKSVLQI